MLRKRLIAVVLLLAGIGIGFFVFASERDTSRFVDHRPFKFGLDISGGTHLIYKADVSKVPVSDVKDSMEALRDVIERRVNLFGVSEPIVQVEQGNGGEQRLIVELPGVTDISSAVKMIGQTPLLEFKTERPDGEEKDHIKKLIDTAQALQEAGNPIPDVILNDPLYGQDPTYVDTALTGAYLKKATLGFDNTTRQPKILLSFNDEGQKMFGELTKANINKTVAIYLDGVLMQAPVVREAITDGNAEISGNYTALEAREIVGRFNSGALPIPVELKSTQTIGASLGATALHGGVRAGVAGVIIVALFLILWYRLPGIIASLALAIYIAIMLAIFKFLPVTLTAAGIAGFILSIGMAVDANVLIFERMKEELRAGKALQDAMHDGFARAWTSIRDSNISSLLSAVILFWFGTSLVQGFALTLGLGVIVSMFSAITLSRSFLYALGTKGKSPTVRFLFGSGLK